ncbi:MAG: GerMN domain-containing protein [Ilumatobacteraceae bacterium]
MRRLLGVVVPVGFVLVAACGSGGATTPTSGVPSTVPATSATVPDTTAPATTPETTAPETTVPVSTLPAEGQDVVAYFVRGEHLVAVRRSVASWDGVELLKALLAGPTAAEAAEGITTVVPSGSEVASVTVDGSEATVDMNAAFEQGGGSTLMMLRVAQVVFAVTQLPDVDTVRFRIDGVPVTSISGEGIVVDGVGRSDFAAVLPEIFVESPLDGDPWVDPMTLAGAADTFEATVNFEVLGADGAVLQEGVTTASCGSGCPGVFAVQLAPLPVGADTPVTIRVFDISEADGSVIDLVELHIG